MKKKINNIQKIIKKYKNLPKNIIKEKNKKIYVNGRIISKRKMGKITFFNIQDINGNIQILSKKKYINKEKYLKTIKKIKIGDIIKIKGILYKTNTNELTIICNYIKILTKTNKYLPDKYNKIKNKEIKIRYRYLDLITNQKTRKIFLTRIKIIKLIREYLNKNNFLEVETPMLHKIAGGANAKPFKTHHKTLNMKMYLRIAPEIYLKTLIIGGFTKIYEINRNFRNEGISNLHNPEFTMIEIYWAYKNYKDMMKLTENIINYIYKNLFKKNFKQIKINKFKKITFNKCIYENCKYFKNIKDINNIKKVNKIANKLGIKKKSYGKILENIFKLTSEKKIIQPTFITKYPIDISPLASKNKKNKNIADRFELFVNGYEIANGFTELNDPLEQENRFISQTINKNLKYDKEYIEALKYGLPPTGGVGIGIDRLIMFFTNSTNIKDVILFPMLKNK